MHIKQSFLIIFLSIITQTISAFEPLPFAQYNAFYLNFKAQHATEEFNQEAWGAINAEVNALIKRCEEEENFKVLLSEVFQTIKSLFLTTHNEPTLRGSIEIAIGTYKEDDREDIHITLQFIRDIEYCGDARWHWVGDIMNELIEFLQNEDSEAIIDIMDEKINEIFETYSGDTALLVSAHQMPEDN